MAHPALQIPEILEQILLDVDMRTLLVSAQRVSQHWNTVISQSQPLQQALFFQPVQNKQQTRIRNPLLEELFWHPDADPQPDLGIPSLKFKVRVPYQDRVFAHRNASWQRMLIQQPPTSKIGFFMGSQNTAYYSNKTIWMMDFYNSSHQTKKKHLRMGDFYAPMRGRGLQCTDDKWILFNRDAETHQECLKSECDVMMARALGECDIVITAWFIAGVVAPRIRERRSDSFMQWVDWLLDEHLDYKPRMKVMNAEDR
ncbi:hypothetical protein MW887_004270 [Aspergillus wentii]|nr:hypothetical protein MW887_004270 [Aspergillus wentii]